MSEKWTIDLSGTIGSNVRIETKDAMYMEGVLTGVDTCAFLMNGETVEFPTALILDGDPGKGADLNRIAVMDVLADEKEEDDDAEENGGTDGEEAGGQAGGEGE